MLVQQAWFYAICPSYEGLRACSPEKILNIKLSETRFSALSDIFGPFFSTTSKL